MPILGDGESDRAKIKSWHLAWSFVPSCCLHVHHAGSRAGVTGVSVDGLEETGRGVTALKARAAEPTGQVAAGSRREEVEGGASGWL